MKTAVKSIALGDIIEDPDALLLGCGDFKDFFSPHGIVGQVRVTRGVCDLLSVIALHPGQGDFGNFLAALKKEFSRIRVLHISNAGFQRHLEKLGFHSDEWLELDGERVVALTLEVRQPVSARGQEGE